MIVYFVFFSEKTYVLICMSEFVKETENFTSRLQI